MIESGDARDEAARSAAAEVLAGLYEAVVDPLHRDSLINAMDAFLETAPEDLEHEASDWRELFKRHFSHAAQILDAPAASTAESPIVFVDKQLVPAIVLTDTLSTVAENELFSTLRGGESWSLQERLAAPADERRLARLLSSSDMEATLLRLAGPADAPPLFAIASRQLLLGNGGLAQHHLVIKIAKATWTADLEPLLASAYHLTPAEIAVLQSLVETGSIAAVAKERERSVRTIRTQLTQIYGKMDVSGQTELALYLATLSQLTTSARRPSDIGLDWNESLTGECGKGELTLRNAHYAWIRYGDPTGIPVVMFHSTTPPDMTPDFRRTCAEHGLRIIAIHRPQRDAKLRGRSADGPEDLAEDYRAILDAEGIDQAVFAGHCSGGLYALACASAFPERCSGLVLIDTGVPFRSRAELKSLPKAPRRTFYSARYLPEVLLVPHRLFANDFKGSPEGEARVIDYFFEGSPEDQELTRTDRRWYEVTRRIIAYSFEDVRCLVADVCRWASDWSTLLEKQSDTPLVFLHGENNRLFTLERVEQVSSGLPNATVLTGRGAGQLAVYQHPVLFAEAVHSLIEG